MTLQVHLEASKYVPKVHLVLFRIVPIDYIAGKLLWGYALNWIKCVSETIYSLLSRHIPMSFSGRKKKKLERIPTNTTKLYFGNILSGDPYLIDVWFIKSISVFCLEFYVANQNLKFQQDLTKVRWLPDKILFNCTFVYRWPSSTSQATVKMEAIAHMCLANLSDMVYIAILL